MKQKELAIVIPAYKSTFLAATLDSIAAQTCKDFTLYIGDDCSPNGIGEIVSRYKGKIPLVYKRFGENLGGRDLVAQWERCIDMAQDEEWIWLFSDDDVMEPQCVEGFYETIKANPAAGLVHFNVSRLDSATERIEPLPDFPEFCQTKDYVDRKLKGRLISFVVEFVVRRDIFFSCGRFQNFDLAWGSDFISWIKFSAASHGIITCGKARVLWRKSGENISPDTSNPILHRKIKSLIRNAKWISDFSSAQGYGHKFFYTKYPLGEIVRSGKILSKRQKKELLSLYGETIKPSLLCRGIMFCIKILYVMNMDVILNELY